MISVCIERLGRSDETLSMIYLPIRNFLDRGGNERNEKARQML